MKKFKLSLFIWLTTLCLVPNILAQSSQLQDTQQKEEKIHEVNRILHLSVNSSINPATLSYFQSGYQKAQSEGYDFILIDMNTPGGLVTTTKDILTLMGDSSVPTIIWIRPEGASATSAGAIISAGAHLLYMSNGTNMGAATPVQMGGDIEGQKEEKDKDNEQTVQSDQENEAPKSVQERLEEELKKNQGGSGDMRAKAVNDLVALIQSLSEARGRNAELFADMIRDAASFKASEAKSENLINDIANNIDDIFEHMDAQTITVKGERLRLDVSSHPQVDVYEMDLGQKLLDIFANPSLAYIFFLIGAALIYLELQAPGGMIAGAIGAVCLIFAGIGFQVLPLNFGALGLVVLAFLLFLMEIYVTSYGILSLAGLASLISGSLFLFRGEDGYLDMDQSLIFSSVAAIVIFMGLIVYIFVRDRQKAHDLDFNNLEGKFGVIMSEQPTLEEGYFYYQVKANGEIWRARTKKEVHVGDSVKILHQDDTHNILEF